MSLFSLTFLAPIALLGVAAISIPIYLHMRHKPRAEVYPFAAIDFLLRAQKKKKRRFQAEQLLLMLFRIGVICLLAFLFAKPYVDDQFRDTAAKNNQPLVLILDDSASMLAGSSNARFFDEAKIQIADILRRRSNSAPTRLMLSSDPRHLSQYKTASELREMIAELKPTTFGHTLDDAYSQAMDLTVSEAWPSATLHFFTDGSLSAWRDLPTNRSDKTEVIYTSMRGDGGDFKNYGIVDVAQAPGDANSVEVTLLNSQNKSGALDLKVEASQGATMRQRIQLDAYGSASHYFGLSEPIPATVQISIPGDGFNLDNQIVFAPKPNKTISVLIVDGDTHPEAIQNESFFLKNALGSSEAEKYGFKFEVVTPVGLNAQKVEAADVLFLLNVDAPMTLLLKDALAKNKGVFIAMGDRMDFDRWNTFFPDYDLQLWESKSLDPSPSVEIKSFDHGFFYPIEEFEWRGYFQDVRIQKMRIMSLGRANFDTPLALPSGSPLLLSKDLQPGRLMVWTTSMDVDWNNFPLEFGFVPFVRQVTAWLAGRDASSSFQSMTTDQVRDGELWDSLSLKYVTDGFRDLDVKGPKPGVYTRQTRGRNQFIQVVLESHECDFRSFDSISDDQPEAEALEELGFRSYLRSDLAPSVQWFLFALILVETLAAARVTSRWGER